MATEIGPKRPTRRPGPDVRGPGFLMSWLGRGFGPKSQKDKDQDAVERAHRLAAFVGGRPVEDVWEQDLAPIFRDFFDEMVRGVIAKSTASATLAPAHPGSCCLQTVNDLYKRIDQAGDIATGVAQRQARGYLTRLAAVEAAKETP